MRLRQDEEWRRVPDNPSYWISNYGRLRHKGKFLSGSVSDVHGHHVYALGHITRHTARLMLEAFVGPCPAGLYATYKDGDKTNLNLSNLAWAKRPHRNPGVKVTPQDIAETVNLYKSGMSRKEISAQQKINYWAVSYRLRRAGLIP